jgi:hypothetical protein
MGQPPTAQPQAGQQPITYFRPNGTSACSKVLTDSSQKCCRPFCPLRLASQSAPVDAGFYTGR